MRAQAKRDAQLDNRIVWKKQMAEREEKARELKEQEMNAPVGSPLNFIKMNSTSKSKNSIIDPKVENRPYPFPIEDASRTEEQFAHRKVNK